MSIRVLVIVAAVVAVVQSQTFVPDYTVNQNVRFLLRDGSVLVSNNLNNQPQRLSRQKQTVFVVHGWNGGPEASVRLIQQTLDNNVPNVQTVFVDWSASAKQDYALAVFSLPGVGAAIGTFMRSQGLNVAQMVHCIGHSLGAHTCGFTGKFLQMGSQTLKRISGLDPAGPGFEESEPALRLDKADAYLVDVVHTDSVIGVAYSLGHLDFYPNYGKDQPGCAPTSQMGDAVPDFNNVGADASSASVDQGDINALFCSHERAVYLYEASISSQCRFYARNCGAALGTRPPSSQTVCAGGMFKLSMMGFPASLYRRFPGSYYVSTESAYPFCRR